MNKPTEQTEHAYHMGNPINLIVVDQLRDKLRPYEHIQGIEALRVLRKRMNVSYEHFAMLFNRPVESIQRYTPKNPPSAAFVLQCHLWMYLLDNDPFIVPVP